MDHHDKVDALQRQGVEIRVPATVEIGDEVDLGQIRGPGTVIHAGCRLRGRDLMVLPGAIIGEEGPATVDGCAVGRRVRLGAGYFADAVFLDDAAMGLGAHVRSGTLLEEEASGAHTVGLKQTILLPFVTVGSLVNFCDVLMAGGTSREDHSEVGSSFIHFNFTPFGPRGDKATASLVGDVPRGVMLRSRRIFLGGQGGLVGPLHVDYGTVLAAGFVYRRDQGPDALVLGEKLVARKLPFDSPRYARVGAKVRRNLTYIGNLAALWHWYGRARMAAARGDEALTELYRRARRTVAAALAERIKRLEQLVGFLEESADVLSAQGQDKEAATQRAVARCWPRLRDHLEGYAAWPAAGDPAGAKLESCWARAVAVGGSYLDMIRRLDDAGVDAGTRWLDGIVAAAESGWDLVAT